MTSLVYIGIAIMVFGGVFSMAWVHKSTMDAVSRQPEIIDKVSTTVTFGFIEAGVLVGVLFCYLLS